MDDGQFVSEDHRVGPMQTRAMRMLRRTQIESLVGPLWAGLGSKPKPLTQPTVAMISHLSMTRSPAPTLPPPSRCIGGRVDLGGGEAREFDARRKMHI